MLPSLARFRSMGTASYTPPPYQYGFADPEQYQARTKPGLTESVVHEISTLKGEPSWMLEQRLRALETFWEKPTPTWGADLSEIDFDEITYFLRAHDTAERSWDEVPEKIKETFERIGVPQAEREYLAGSGAQYDSESVYHNLSEEWKALGVIFCDLDTALREHPQLVQRYFGTLVPAADNTFAALNSAVWSGGSFVYVPEDVHVTMPLQAYFRINAQKAGQFERTLIIVEAGANVHYVEGCSAPSYSAGSLHAAVVEVFAAQGSRVRYTTVQNWSDNVYNLVTKRARAQAGATVEWVDCNLGSRVTMKYPAVQLVGEGAHAEVLSLALAGPGQHQDAGSKIHHLAPNTTSTITSKSVSFGGGRSSYRGLVVGNRASKGMRSRVVCDALLIDGESRSDTYPTIDIAQPDSTVEHEASVSAIAEAQLSYLRSRGLTEAEAASLMVHGFLEPVIKQLPMEFAVEMNRLIELQMEGSVG